MEKARSYDDGRFIKLGLKLKTRFDQRPQISTSDVSNVRSWHAEGRLRDHHVCCEREAEVSANCDLAQQSHLSGL